MGDDEPPAPPLAPPDPPRLGRAKEYDDLRRAALAPTPAAPPVLPTVVAPVAAPFAAPPPPELVAGDLARARRRLWRPTLIWVANIVVCAAVAGGTIADGVLGSVEDPYGERIDTTVTEVVPYGSTIVYRFADTTEAAPAPVELEVGDHVAVLTDGSGAITDVVADPVPEWEYGAIVLAALVAFLSLLGLLWAVVRAARPWRATRRPMGLADVCSRGHGRRRVESGGFLVNLLTLPFGLIYIPGRRVGRWFEFGVPQRGAFQTERTRDQRAVVQEGPVWVPLGTAAPKAVYLAGSRRIVRTHPLP